MQQAEEFVGIGHIANPGVPGRILQPIPETGKDEAHHQHGIGRMETIHHVGDDMASRADGSDSSLAERHMDLIVDDGSQHVSHQGRKKDQRHDGVGQMVVRL